VVTMRMTLRVIAIWTGLALPGVAWAQVTGVPTPVPGLSPDPGKGERLYQKICASCHGTDLRGTDKGPSHLHPVYQPNLHSDMAFQLAVKNGSPQHHWRFGPMPAVPGLTPQDVGHIVAVRREQRKAGLY
jgi:mono/diheme cytochrome c family protein